MLEILLEIFLWAGVFWLFGAIVWSCAVVFYIIFRGFLYVTGAKKNQAGMNRKEESIIWHGLDFFGVCSLATSIIRSIYLRPQSVGKTLASLISVAVFLYVSFNWIQDVIYTFRDEKKKPDIPNIQETEVSDVRNVKDNAVREIVDNNPKSETFEESANRAFDNIKKGESTDFSLHYISVFAVDLQTARKNLGDTQYFEIENLYKRYAKRNYKVEIDNLTWKHLYALVVLSYNDIAPWENLVPINKEDAVSFLSILTNKETIIPDGVRQLFKKMWDEVDNGQQTQIADFYSLPASTTYQTPTTPQYQKPAPSASQIAQADLDSYISKWKTKEGIGLMYERYIGYLCEQQGLKVKYNGALKGKKDKGRDLIVFKGNTVYIVQCKNWSKKEEKVIYSKHIEQIHGSTEWMARKDRSRSYVGVFVTNIKLDDEALDCAKTLSIIVYENVPLEKNRPYIKCNKTSGGKRIYHLPTEGKSVYDMVELGGRKGCFYAWTVEEAESKGFRRAYKWNPNKES